MWSDWKVAVGVETLKPGRKPLLGYGSPTQPPPSELPNNTRGGPNNHVLPLESNPKLPNPEVEVTWSILTDPFFTPLLAKPPPPSPQIPVVPLLV